MKPLKVELSEVVSSTLIFPPGATRLELSLRMAGELTFCDGWL